MSRSNDVSTSLRLSRGKAKLVRIGLVSIATGDRLWKARGSPLYSPARMVFLPCRVDEGAYRAGCLATVSRVILAATFTGQSRRLRLGSPRARCLPPRRARHGDARVRHGHMEAWVLNHEAASRKLLATLEPNVIRINPRSTVWAPRTLVKSNPKLESPRSVMPTRLPEPMPCLLSIPTYGKL